MAYPELLLEALQEFDCDGAKGSDPFLQRTNLLIDVTTRNFADDELRLGFQQMFPEGFGVTAFMHDFLTVPADTPGDDDLMLVWDTQKALPPTHVKIWVCQVFQSDLDVRTFFYDEHSSWFFADNPGNLPRSLQHVEFFCGGVGGWSSALRFLTNEIRMPSRSIGIEIDRAIAKTYAINHCAAFVCPKEDLPENILTYYDGNWVICDDVCSNFWTRAISTIKVDLVTISSPCGPWSSASTGLGLEKHEGNLMLHAILKCRFLRPTYIAIENVAGFAMHHQKHFIEKAIRWIGYRLMWQKTVDVRNSLGVARARWLALAIRVHSSFPQVPFPTWRLPTIDTDHAVFLRQWDEDTKQQLAITEAVYKVASDPIKAGRHGRTKTPTEVLSSRIYGHKMHLPTFMAQYGSQHELPNAHLDEHTYLGFFLHDHTMPQGARFFHPAEVNLLHGVIDWMFVSHDLKHAWRTAGNSILPIHAMIPLVAMLGPHLTQTISIHDAVLAFLQRRIKANEMQVFQVPQGELYTRIDTVPVQPFLESLNSLHHMDDQQPLQVWIPQVGTRDMQPVQPTLDDLPDTQFDASAVSGAISVASSNASECPPNVILQAKIQGLAFLQSFWFASDLPAAVVETPWNHAFASEFPDLHALDGLTILRPRPCPVDFGNPYRDVLVQILVDHQMTLMKMEHAVPIQNHPEVSLIADELFDQFGRLEPHQCTADHTAIMTRPICNGEFRGPVLQLLAALELCPVQTHWNSDNDAFCLCYQGDPICLQTIADFWTAVVPLDMQSFLGRTVQSVPCPDGVMIQFVPCRTHGVMSPNAFAVQLSVLAFRPIVCAVNQTLPQEGSKPVLIKWTTRPLFNAELSGDFTIAMIIKLLHHALTPANGSAQHRIVHQAKQIMPEAYLRDLEMQSRRQAVVLHVVLQMHGGGGAKNQHKILTQTAIASFLLEMGFDLTWVTQTVETLTNKLSLQKLQQFSAMPPGGQKTTALRTLLTEVNLAMPELPKPQTKKLPQGLPWNQPKRRKGEGDINPADFDILETFFQNEDGTPCPQVSAVRPQATGVCLLSSLQAEPWLSTSDKISSDELALLVIGKSPSTTVTGENVVVPCRNLDGHMVLLHCHLYQLGTKLVTYQKGDPKQISADHCSLVAITLHKDDFQPEPWAEALHRTVPFIRQVLDQENLADCVLSIWGRSFRQGKSPCPPHQATTIQVHCSVPKDKLHKLLAKSGFNKLFCTPKNSAGRLDTGYQVIWLSCDSCQAAVSSAKVANPLGLVKGRKTLGIRVTEADFAAAWQLLCPQQPQPIKQAGEHVYRVDGLPFGVTIPMMTQWCAKIGWTAQPIRALGPQSMLMRSDNAPPEGLLMFNTQAILTRWLPPRAQQNGPLLVGPKATKTREFVDIGDPWAKWSGTRPQASQAAASTGRTVDGPTELRLQAQDQKLKTIEQQLEKLAINQETMIKQTDARFQAAELREKQHVQQVAHTMDALKIEVAKSLDVSFQKNTQMMDERMAELKHLLISQKRPAPADDAMDD